MKKMTGLLVAVLILLFTANLSFAHEATYSVKKIGENTITITVSADAKSGKGIEITSASKRNGKVLNIFYRTVEGSIASDSMDVDLKTMLTPIRIILTNISEPDKPLFSDIKDIEQAEYIQHLHDMGAINGYADGTFKPNSSVTRAEFVTMLLKALNVTISKKTVKTFKDTEKHWAKDAINTAYSMKIINGFQDGTFKPENKITVAEAAKIIDSLYTYSSNVQTTMPKLNEKHWAYAVLKRIVTAGIILEKDTLYSNFKEDAPLSRANCAMMISRAITTN